MILLHRSNLTALAAGPHLLVTHPVLNVGFELGPQVGDMHGHFVDDLQRG